ncbi:nucleotide disphospho-sugar-binding domain-containing protein [Microlunatus endophyticus]|uniref:nucleotide disphospho-sugar-binding domain-containing protein n=1 Tax=Microlunatus endophyticus TaxID=1716077 RepID=UPI001665BB57|nr:nucleotide disphospho-sugar-binding domain-containing protein [Microlunatus endophyticus]
MGRILVASTPVYGHLGPLTRIARALQDAGHEVVLLAGDTPGQGAEAPRRPPPASGRGSGSAPSARGTARWRPRWIKGRDEILDTFVVPLRAQADAVAGLLHPVGRTPRFDAVVADVSFLGVQPLLASCSPGLRPPVIGISVTPIMLPSQDCAPFGTALRPWDGPAGRTRNRQTDWLLRNGPLRVVQATIDTIAAGIGVGPGEITLFGAIARFDRVFQLGLPELEYPRRELPAFVEFVGPLPASCGCGSHLILDQRKPVVHVTQGTLDNADPTRLLLPAIRALAGDELTVIASTGGADTAITSLGAHDHPGVQVVDFACYCWLLPRTDLMITNGGYGGVQLAARDGVPLIVAGDTQDKAEVAARVAWSGIGLDLRSGRPRPRQIRNAVRRVLADRRCALKSAALAASAAGLGDPMERIVAAVGAAL